MMSSWGLSLSRRVPWWNNEWHCLPASTRQLVNQAKGTAMDILEIFFTQAKAFKILLIFL
jgi:hypothetical protein